MISTLTTSSNWIVHVCLRNMRSKVKLLQLCILEFIKLGIHVPTKLVTSISWLQVDRILSQTRVKTNT